MARLKRYQTHRLSNATVGYSGRVLASQLGFDELIRCRPALEGLKLENLRKYKAIRCTIARLHPCKHHRALFSPQRRPSLRVPHLSRGKPFDTPHSVA